MYTVLCVATEKPYAIHPHAFQKCCGHLGGYCERFPHRPYLLSTQYNGSSYRIFLEGVLPEFLQGVSTIIRNQM